MLGIGPVEVAVPGEHPGNYISPLPSGSAGRLSKL